MKMQPGILFSLVTLALLAGCNSPQKLQQRAPAMPVPSVSVSRNVQPVSQDIYAQPAPEVVRYDRYLLVSTAPQAAQRDPLSQVIDIRIHPDTGYWCGVEQPETERLLLWRIAS